LSVAIPVALYAFGVAPISSVVAKEIIQDQNPVALTALQAREGEHTARTGDQAGLAADLIATPNDNWRSDHEAEIIATGIPPTNDLESANCPKSHARQLHRDRSWRQQYDRCGLG